jgi:hypothetical protein
MSEPKSWGVDSMAGPLRRVAMRAPEAMRTADHNRWHYAKELDAPRLDEQYSVFVDAVIAGGAEIVWMPHQPDDDLADSVFTYDPSFIVPGGAIVLRPGKPSAPAKPSCTPTSIKRRTSRSSERSKPPARLKAAIVSGSTRRLSLSAGHSAPTSPASTSSLTSSGLKESRSPNTISHTTWARRYAYI